MLSQIKIHVHSKNGDIYYVQLEINDEQIRNQLLDDVAEYVESFITNNLRDIKSYSYNIKEIEERI